MKILHCCLSCFYNEGYNYQENMLPKQNKTDGHEVMIIASTEVFVNNKSYGYIAPCDYVNDDGIRVVRVPYRKIVNQTISAKIRAYRGVYKLVEEFEPDVILFHGISAWELLTIKKYVKGHDVKLFVDNHANIHNSAQGWLSRNILHRFFYKSVFRRVLPLVEKVLCIGFRERDFARDFYGVPEDKLQHYPLGGDVIEGEDYTKRRERIRTELGVSPNEILFVHSGKMDRHKRTDMIAKAFNKIDNSKWRLVIIGELLDDIKQDVLQSVSEDKRIDYLGWKSGEELLDYLCAADVYLQPGAPSATLQNAMCCGCAIMAQPIREYKYLLQDQGIYVGAEENIYNGFKQILDAEERIADMKEKTFERAKEILDYRSLAAVLYK